MLVHRTISIHAPARGATKSAPYSDLWWKFQSTPPHGERRWIGFTGLLGFYLFQSTPPSRGATVYNYYACGKRKNFNPRPPRGERPGRSGHKFRVKQFQSTPPSRGATSAASVGFGWKRISIHAPLAGSDPLPWIKSQFSQHFNPRPPRGERQHQGKHGGRHQGISIHAPLAGSDRDAVRGGKDHEHFNPRPPRGERPAGRELQSAADDFNPRPPGVIPEGRLVTGCRRQVPFSTHPGARRTR